MPKPSHVVVVQIVRTPVGGIRKHVLSIIDKLEQINTPCILVTNVAQSDANFHEYIKSNHKNLSIIDLPIIDRPQLKDLYFVLKLFFQLRKYSILCIHGHGAKGGLYSRFLGLFLQTKSFYTPHGGSLHDMFTPIMGFLYRWIEKLQVPLTTKFIFESQYSLTQFKRKIASDSQKIILNTNGIRPFKYTPLSFEDLKKASPLIISSFGALRFIKGQDIAIAAMSILKKSGINCEYHIYGVGELLEDYRALANSLNVADVVKFKGEVSNVEGAIRQSHIVIHPSRHESFGYVALEAMSVGRPVVASNIGGLSEVIHNNMTGLLVETDPNEFANAIKKIINDSHWLDNFNQFQRNSVISDFDEEKNLNKLLTIYNTEG